jgi:stress response protein SCP2
VESTISELALAVPFLVQLVEARLATFAAQDFQTLVTARPQLMELNSARERAVRAYRDSGSFDQANEILIASLYPSRNGFTLTQVSTMVEGGFANG